jgi:hypothetical protein
MVIQNLEKSVNTSASASIGASANTGTITIEKKTDDFAVVKPVVSPSWLIPKDVTSDNVHAQLALASFTGDFPTTKTLSEKLHRPYSKPEYHWEITVACYAGQGAIAKWLFEFVHPSEKEISGALFASYLIDVCVCGNDDLLNFFLKEYGQTFVPINSPYEYRYPRFGTRSFGFLHVHVALWICLLKNNTKMADMLDNYLDQKKLLQCFSNPDGFDQIPGCFPSPPIIAEGIKQMDEESMSRLIARRNPNPKHISVYGLEMESLLYCGAFTAAKVLVAHGAGITRLS